MSNETMSPDLIPAWRAATAACLEDGHYVAPATPEQWAKALRAAFACNAEQGEQQPFGHYFYDDPKVFAMPGAGFKRGASPPPNCVDSIPLYTLPQVVPFYGGEAAAFDTWFRGEQGTAYDGSWSFARAAWMHRAALSAAPAAPETDSVLIGQAVCYGDEWFKELTVEGVTFLAPLDEHERACFILAAKKRRRQEAAPAPVAGDAACSLDQAEATRITDEVCAQLAERGTPDPDGGGAILIGMFTASAGVRLAVERGYAVGLAQDRASQSDPAATDGASLIAKERGRQISAEGWSAGHDDAYGKLELVRAAVAYALYGVGQKVVDDSFWPWHLDWWKPSDRVRNLVKAGALIAAEIDRLNRAAAAAVPLTGAEQDAV